VTAPRLQWNSKSLNIVVWTDRSAADALVFNECSMIYEHFFVN